MNYQELKLIEAAKEQLRKAFKKNAALRATKVKLEKRLESITASLMEKKQVDEILNDPKFKSLTVLREKGFLEDIEKQVAADWQKSGRKKSKKAGNGGSSAGERKRMSPEQKQNIVREIIADLKGQQIKVSQISAALKARGITQPFQSWVKPLGVPDSAYKSLGSKRDGTRFFPDRVSWLKDHD